MYESTLASVVGGVTAFRDFTYDIAPAPGGFALSYRPTRVDEKPALSWPGLSGLRIPSYDRSNGLSFGFGPQYTVPHTRLILSPAITYRTQLGRLDPGVAIVDSLGQRAAVELIAERATMSNEYWIRSDLANSASFVAGGSDARNYYRATRAELTAARRWESASGALTPFVGALVERARSVRPDVDATGGPWTFLGRRDREQGLRPNPQIDPGTTTSAIAGLRWRWEGNGLTARAVARGEAGRTEADCDACSARSSTTFQQLTVDGAVEFPTFGAQSLEISGHAVTSAANGDVPRQRFVYLGGSGTLSTLDMLSLGGDQLVYADFSYNIPIQRIELPMLGSPIVTLREALGGAAVQRFPAIHQATGVRVSISVLYAEFLVDPSTRNGHTGFGVSLSR